MDLLTIIGLLLGISCVWYSMASGHILSLLFDLTSFILVLGGTIASTIMTYPWNVMKIIPKAIGLTIFPGKMVPYEKTIDRVCGLAEVATLRGVDVLSEHITEEDDELLRSGVRMLLNDWSDIEIKESLEESVNGMVERHTQIQKVFLSMGSYAPVYGLLGTLIGVLGVLRYLGDPTAMGASMTVAIVTTFYGIFFANFVGIPMAGKLESYTNYEIRTKILILNGIVAIKREMYPYLIREKLEKTISEANRKEQN